MSGFACPLFPSSNPLFPLRGKVYPSPIPPPLDLDGGGRERSERPRWPKTAPRGPQRAQDDLQDGSGWLKMAQDGSQDAPRGPISGPRRLQVAREPPKEAPQEANTFQKQMKNMYFVFSRLFASDGFRGLQMAPRGPKRAPREAQERPRAPQELSKRGLRGDLGGSRGGARIE